MPIELVGGIQRATGAVAYAQQPSPAHEVVHRLTAPDPKQLAHLLSLEQAIEVPRPHARCGDQKRAAASRAIRLLERQLSPAFEPLKLLSKRARRDLGSRHVRHDRGFPQIVKAVTPRQPPTTKPEWIDRFYFINRLWYKDVFACRAPASWAHRRETPPPPCTSIHT